MDKVSASIRNLSIATLGETFKDVHLDKTLHGDHQTKTLFTTDSFKGTVINLLAKIGIPYFEKMQQKERDSGIGLMRNMLMTEYREPGLADKIFSAMKHELHIDVKATGIKLAHLGAIQYYAENLNSGNNTYDREEAFRINFPVLENKVTVETGAPQTDTTGEKVDVMQTSSESIDSRYDSIIENMSDEYSKVAENNGGTQNLDDLLKTTGELSSSKLSTGLHIEEDISSEDIQKLVNQMDDDLDDIEMEDTSSMDSDLEMLLKYAEENKEKIEASGSVSIEDALKMIEEVEVDREDTKIAKNIELDVLNEVMSTPKNNSKENRFVDLIDFDKL